MPGRARTAAAAVFAAWGTVAPLAPAAAQTTPSPEPRPELTTLLGRPVFARPDDGGAIARADAALAAAPGDIDRLLAAARARCVAPDITATTNNLRDVEGLRAASRRI